MTTQNYEPKLQMVKERLTKIDEIMEKFKDLPDVQEKLRGAKVALQKSEEEIMHYYDIKDLSKHGLN
jgi:PhoPQ-activated pathogenicity-related protein|tara:strand:+ start:489 stop:689 length:201 start_codon:yes stop_codon:yes gene_type:complete